MEPPGPIPNPEVKRRSANGSETIGLVRVGRRQVYARLQVIGAGLFFCSYLTMFTAPRASFTIPSEWLVKATRGGSSPILFREQTPNPDAPIVGSRILDMTACDSLARSSRSGHSPVSLSYSMRDLSSIHLKTSARNMALWEINAALAPGKRTV